MLYAVKNQRFGEESKILSQPVSDGALLFATDTKKIYLDKGSERIEIASIQDLSNYITSSQLQEGLNTKAPLSHSHTVAQVTDLDTTISAAIGEEASARQKQDQLLEQSIDDKLGADDIIAGSNVQVSHDDESGHITISATVTKDTNTTYTLTKSGSTITLEGSDGSSSEVTDTNTTYTLSSFGITATAAELNYMDGVTSNVQTQLNGKLSTSGTAAAATKLATARTIALSGDVIGSASFNGTADATIAASIAANAVGTNEIAANAVTLAKLGSDVGTVAIQSSQPSDTNIKLWVKI